MRARISSFTFGRSTVGRDRQRQYRRKPARRHPITVSGFTMNRTSDHRGQMLLRVVQNRRSRRLGEGPRRLHLSTATCWRNATILSKRLRKKTRQAARTAGIKSSTNQRCSTHQYRCGTALGISLTEDLNSFSSVLTTDNADRRRLTRCGPQQSSEASFWWNSSGVATKDTLTKC